MKFDLFYLFQEFLARQRDKALIWAAVFLGIGASLYFSLTTEPSPFVVGGLFCGFISAFLFARHHYRHNPDSPIVLMGLVASGIILTAMAGFTAAAIKTDIVKTPMLARESRPVMIEATLDHREDQESKKGVLLFLSDIHIEKWASEDIPVKVRITSKKQTSAKAGDRIQVLVKLTPLSGAVALDAYDFARHYYFESIGALGYTLSDIKIVSTAPTGLFNLETLRNRISSHIATIVPAREAGIVSALMTGERAAIVDEDWDALRASGLAHIISISGLHVVMVAAPVFFLVRLLFCCIPFLALRWPIKKIAAFTALLVCCLYVGLVVPSVPTTRALLMTGVGLIAIMLDRSPFSLRLVAFSAILVLIIAPESIWSVSFQMSFAAVTALVAVAEASRPWVAQYYSGAGWLRKFILFVVGTITTSFVASLATAPFSLYHFQQVASYSVLANALSVPISGVMIMPMVMISFVLMPFGLADWSLGIMGTGVTWLLELAKWTQSLPGSVITTPALPDMFVVMMTFAGLSLILLYKREKFLAVLPLVLACLSIGLYQSPDILVSQDGSVLAFGSGEHIYLSSARKDAFTVEAWLKRWNRRPEDVIPFPRQGRLDIDKESSLTCDAGACRLEAASRRISYGHRSYELQQDCNWANIIISDVRLPRSMCGSNATTIISYYDLRDRGAVAIYLDAQPVVQYARPRGQQRPWQQVHKKSFRANDMSLSKRTAPLEFEHGQE